MWKTKVGLEIHAQVTLASKLFSGSSAIIKDKIPNTCVSFFDAALPGTLPRLNKRVVEQAILASVALNCELNNISFFERKHYFYQDLPLGYQITQHKKPIAEKGNISFDVQRDGKFLYRKSLDVMRIQIEQDSGKSLHDAHPNRTLIDLNRAGSALLEIVFSPTLENGDEAASALRSVQWLLRHVGVCDGNLQDGSMRCDVNVSVHKVDANSNTVLIDGPRVEVKNINSMQMVSNAVDYETKRHIELLDRGEVVQSATRGYDSVTSSTYHMRYKESTVDYRIFQDPDIPALELTDEDIANGFERYKNIEMPADTIKRMLKYNLSGAQIDVMVRVGGVAYFEEVMQLLGHTTGEKLNKEKYISDGAGDNMNIGNSVTSPSVDAPPAAPPAPATPATFVFNWMFGDLLGEMNTIDTTFVHPPLSASLFCKVISMQLNGTISAAQTKLVFKELFDTIRHIEWDKNKKLIITTEPEDVVKRKDWVVISDSIVIQRYVEESLSNPKNSLQLQKYLDGKDSMAKFFFGDIMKLSKGQANPTVTDRILKEALTVRRGSGSSS